MNTPFVIEQTIEQTQNAVALHKNAELSSIRLAKSKAESTSWNIASDEQVPLNIAIKATKSDLTDEKLVIDVLFRLSGQKVGTLQKMRPTVCVECTFELCYVLAEGYMPSAEQVNSFKDGNAIFNCWPYCRQYMQEMLSRMGYPSITLPFLRVVTKANKTSGNKSRKV